MHPRRAGSLGTSDAVREWVARSCAAQGVPEKVSDPMVLENVGTLLGLDGAARPAKRVRAGWGQTAPPFFPTGLTTTWSMTAPTIALCRLRGKSDHASRRSAPAPI